LTHGAKQFLRAHHCADRLQVAAISDDGDVLSPVEGKVEATAKVFALRVREGTRTQSLGKCVCSLNLADAFWTL